MICIQNQFVGGVFTPLLRYCWCDQAPLVQMKKLVSHSLVELYFCRYSNFYCKLPAETTTVIRIFIFFKLFHWQYYFSVASVRSVGKQKEIGSVIRVQIPDEVVCVLLHQNTLENYMNPSPFPCLLWVKSWAEWVFQLQLWYIYILTDTLYINFSL